MNPLVNLRDLFLSCEHERALIENQERLRRIQCMTLVRLKEFSERMRVSIEENRSHPQAEILNYARLNIRSFQELDGFVPFCNVGLDLSYNEIESWDGMNRLPPMLRFVKLEGNPLLNYIPNSPIDLSYDPCG